MRGSTIETHTPTQLAQEAEEESESLEYPRSSGPQHSEQTKTRIEEWSQKDSEPLEQPATIQLTAVRNLADHFNNK